MRSGKSFLILLVLALGIGGYAYFVESKRDVSDTPDAKKATKVLSLQSDKVEELELKSAGGDVTRVKKTGTTWQIVAPAAMDADQEVIGSLISSLESLESSTVVDENPASVKDFGLEPARVTIGVRQAGETAFKTLQLGNKTATGADLYVRIDGQPKVMLIGATSDDTFNRSTFDLRDKTVLKFDREKVDTVKLEPAGSGALSFVKKGEDWRLAAPDAKADFSTVDSLVSRLHTLKMKAVVAADAAADLKKYGLDKPQGLATIGAGSSRATLAIGGKTDDPATVYARDLSRPMVFTIEASVAEDLKKKTADWRAKDLFAFKSFTAVSVDLTQGKDAMSFVKEKLAASPAPGASAPSSPTETWKQTKPAAKTVDQAKFEDLLTSISTLRADTFTDKALTGGEEFVVTARFGDAAAPTEERVTFRKSGDVVHAIRAGEAGAAVVSKADYDKVLAGLKELSSAK